VVNRSKTGRMFANSVVLFEDLFRQCSCCKLSPLTRYSDVAAEANLASFIFSLEVPAARLREDVVVVEELEKNSKFIGTDCV